MTQWHEKSKSRGDRTTTLLKEIVVFSISNDYDYVYNKNLMELETRRNKCEQEWRNISSGKVREDLTPLATWTLIFPFIEGNFYFLAVHNKRPKIWIILEFKYTFFGIFQLSTVVIKTECWPLWLPHIGHSDIWFSAMFFPFLFWSLWNCYFMPNLRYCKLT